MGEKESKEAFVEIPSIPVGAALLEQITMVLRPDESLEDFVVEAARVNVDLRRRAALRAAESRLDTNSGWELDRVATSDEELGMAWWNALETSERARWLREAGSAVPAHAWAAFKKTPG